MVARINNGKEKFWLLLVPSKKRGQGCVAVCEKWFKAVL